MNYARTLAEVCDEVASNLPPETIVPFKHRKSYFNGEVLRRYYQP